jgi:predicted small secreted protein
MNLVFKKSIYVALLLSSLLLSGCSGNVGIGMSVGIPIGSHGYMSVGGTRWH